MIANTATSNRLVRFVNRAPVDNKISKIEVFYNGQVPVVSGYVTSELHGVEDILLFNTQGEKAFRIDYRSPNQIQRSCSQFSLNSEPSQDYVLINEVNPLDTQMYSLSVYRVIETDEDGFATEIQLLQLDPNDDPREDTPRLSKVESTNCLFQ